jgi:hypothetical protein
MNNAIAFGAYLVGLTTHIVAIKATVNGGDFTIEHPNVKPERRGQSLDAWQIWARELRIRIHGALASLGIDSGFTIAHSNAHRLWTLRFSRLAWVPWASSRATTCVM